MSRPACTLLIVDDEFATLEVLAMLFSGEGFVVRKAADGADALAILAAEEIDLVVSDVQMPVLDGETLADRMRADARLALVPIILTSANALQRTHAAPVVAFVPKPYRFDDLLALVRAALVRGESR